jgi:hypothetical protein
MLNKEDFSGSSYTGQSQAGAAWCLAQIRYIGKVTVSTKTKGDQTHHKLELLFARVTRAGALSTKWRDLSLSFKWRDGVDSEFNRFLFAACGWTLEHGDFGKIGSALETEFKDSGANFRIEFDEANKVFPTIKNISRLKTVLQPKTPAMVWPEVALNKYPQLRGVQGVTDPITSPAPVDPTESNRPTEPATPVPVTKQASRQESGKAGIQALEAMGVVDNIKAESKVDLCVSNKATEHVSDLPDPPKPVFAITKWTSKTFFVCQKYYKQGGKNIRQNYVDPVLIDVTMATILKQYFNGTGGVLEVDEQAFLAELAEL